MIAQLSDPHLRPSDPAAVGALDAAVHTVLGLSVLPDAVLVSGDLVHDGDDPASYAQVRELLAVLPMPVVAIPGNHDNRATMRATGFATEPGNALHHDLDAGPIRLLALDDHIPGDPAGELGAAGLEWLRTRLARRPDTPTVIALHHPAWAIGLPALDKMGLVTEDCVALAALLAAAPQVIGLVAGHVHRASVTTFAGRPAVTAGSVHTQARLDIGAQVHVMELQPPAILLHCLGINNTLITHFQPVLR